MRCYEPSKAPRTARATLSAAGWVRFAACECAHGTCSFDLQFEARLTLPTQPIVRTTKGPMALPTISHLLEDHVRSVVLDPAGHAVEMVCTRWREVGIKDTSAGKQSWCEKGSTGHSVAVMIAPPRILVIRFGEILQVPADDEDVIGGIDGVYGYAPSECWDVGARIDLGGGLRYVITACAYASASTGQHYMVEMTADAGITTLEHDGYSEARGGKFVAARRSILGRRTNRVALFFRQEADSPDAAVEIVERWTADRKLKLRQLGLDVRDDERSGRSHVFPVSKIAKRLEDSIVHWRMDESDARRDQDFDRARSLLSLSLPPTCAGSRVKSIGTLWDLDSCRAVFHRSSALLSGDVSHSAQRRPPPSLNRTFASTLRRTRISWTPMICRTVRRSRFAISHVADDGADDRERIKATRFDLPPSEEAAAHADDEDADETIDPAADARARRNQRFIWSSDEEDVVPQSKPPPGQADSDNDADQSDVGEPIEPPFRNKPVVRRLATVCSDSRQRYDLMDLDIETLAHHDIVTPEAVDEARARLHDHGQLPHAINAVTGRRLNAKHVPLVLAPSTSPGPAGVANRARLRQLEEAWQEKAQLRLLCVSNASSRALTATARSCLSSRASAPPPSIRPSSGDSPRALLETSRRGVRVVGLSAKSACGSSPGATISSSRPNTPCRRYWSPSPTCATS